MLGREANLLLKRLAQSISIKWEKPLEQTTGWLRAKLSFAILRATNLCLRGSRTKWRSGVGMDDGAGLLAELDKHFYFIPLFCHFVVYAYVLFVCHIYVCYSLCESLLLSITHTVVDLTFIMEITKVMII